MVSQLLVKQSVVKVRQTFRTDYSIGFAQFGYFKSVKYFAIFRDEAVILAYNKNISIVCFFVLLTACSVSKESELSNRKNFFYEVKKKDLTTRLIPDLNAKLHKI